MKVTKAQQRRDEILKFCCKGYKTIIEIADHVELTVGYAKTILKEFIERDLMYIHETKDGKSYHTVQHVCMECLDIKPQWK